MNKLYKMYKECKGNSKIIPKFYAVATLNDDGTIKSFDIECAKTGNSIVAAVGVKKVPIFELVNEPVITKGNMYPGMTSFRFCSAGRWSLLLEIAEKPELMVALGTALHKYNFKQYVASSANELSYIFKITGHQKMEGVEGYAD